MYACLVKQHALCVRLNNGSDKVGIKSIVNYNSIAMQGL